MTGRGRAHRFATAALAVATLFALSGCVAADVPSGAHDESTVTAREEAITTESAALEIAAIADPAAEGAADTCRHGQNNWKIKDAYRWTCGHSTRWVVPIDIADPTEMIAAYRTHLTGQGCYLDHEYEQLEYYWSTLGAAGQNAHGEPYTIDDLLSARTYCGDNQTISVRFGTPGGLDATWIEQTLDGEVIEDRPIPMSEVRAIQTPHIVVLETGTGYHYVPWQPEPEPDPEDDEPLPCFCHSGGDCDCPGG